MWLKFAVGSFSSVLSRQKGPFPCCLCMCVQFVCLHMYACSSEEMHKREIALCLLSGLCWNLTFSEMMRLVWACLQRVLCLFIAHHMYTLRYLQAETAQTGNLCLGQCVIKPGFLCEVSKSTARLITMNRVGMFRYHFSFAIPILIPGLLVPIWYQCVFKDFLNPFYRCVYY